MSRLKRRAWIGVALVLGISVLLALVSSRVGPPRAVTLTVRGMPGVSGTVQVASGFRGELPFTVELALPVEPEGSISVGMYTVQPLPGSDGSLQDGLEAADERTPAIWWVTGEKNGLVVTVGFEIEAWDADGNRLEPLELTTSPEPGVARTIVVGRPNETPAAEVAGPATDR